MSTTKTIDISVLPEAEQDLIKALFDKCCERVKPKVVEVKRKVWKPKIGEHYWYLSGDGNIGTITWCGSKLDADRYKLGNCFRTEEEAKFAREKKKVEVELERYGKEHNNPAKEEWDGINTHYRIGYDLADDDLVTTSAITIRRIGDIYFTSKEVAKDAANKIGTKRIIKYLFDVDCEVDE
jgi:hypothetical protein|nr:MAG TPA: hypothetical protein [Caudoviricetes sp.]